MFNSELEAIRSYCMKEHVQFQEELEREREKERKQERKVWRKLSMYGYCLYSRIISLPLLAR